ncbi:MAG: DUF3459 domain-containing protein [Deltaproteobacteria bacterium]|nr:DUF3459 domain-containing protein [Deltaproteobacteria bacterium]
MTTAIQHLWWQRGIVYHVYPRSFQDSDGDGVGDLRGVARRLDYLQQLGVDAVWLSPIFPSPLVDFGYDISDYCGVDPRFGTLSDLDALLSALHDRGMKLILDFVPNHTSDQHPWFIESRSSRANPRRDWYLWRDPAPDGGPPNNWLGHFGGSAWSSDPATGQYYFHAFFPGQPDLNWRHPEVRSAMAGVVRFWLDRGVDGFRIDVLWHLIKDDRFRDNPPNPDFRPGMGPSRRLLPIYTADRPEVHDVVRELRAVFDSYPERLMVGEIYLPVERLVTYYGRNLDEAHLPFNFQLIRLPWQASTIKQAIDRYQSLLPPGAWPNWVLGNHDHHRIATRVGRDQARVAAMLLLTLRGTPTLYYGDEIGMLDSEIPADRVQDPYERNNPGLGLGRDPERNPMAWDATRHAGFTTGEPWLPLAADCATCNVEVEARDPRSMLSLHRRLIALRRAEPALAMGDYLPLDCSGDLLVYGRRHGDRRLIVALNLGQRPQRAAIGGFGGTVALSTHLDREGEAVGGAVDLRPDEGVVLIVG